MNVSRNWERGRTVSFLGIFRFSVKCICSAIILTHHETGSPMAYTLHTTGALSDQYPNGSELIFIE
jgi:hypothetical protein